MTASWTRPVPGLFITGLGTGVINAALGRIAVESVPHGRAGMGGGANNTARYMGAAAGAALIVSIASAGGTHGLIAGWNIAASYPPGYAGWGWRRRELPHVATPRRWPRERPQPQEGPPARGPSPVDSSTPARGSDFPDGGWRAPANNHTH